MLSLSLIFQLHLYYILSATSALRRRAWAISSAAMAFGLKSHMDKTTLQAVVLGTGCFLELLLPASPGV